MCDYLSAIGLLDGDVYHQDGEDRHSELLRKLAPKLNIGAQQLAENSFELEFKPGRCADLGQIELYALDIDKFIGYGEPSPHRSSLEFVRRQEKIKDLMKIWQAKLLEVARSKIISSGHIEVLEPGDWVLCGDVRVERMSEHSRVIALLDDAQIAQFARNADITVYDKNHFPDVPRDYQPSFDRKPPLVVSKIVSELNAPEEVNWMNVRLFGEYFNSDPAAVHEAEMFRKHGTVRVKSTDGKNIAKGELVIFDDVTPCKKA